MKKVAVFGSTGSIGTQTLDVVRKHRDRFRIVALTASGSKLELLQSQIEEFAPEFVGTCNHIELELPEGCTHIIGQECSEEIARICAADIFVIALSGLSGVKPTYIAAGSGKRVALSNKESIVSAGELILKRASETGTEIIPVDSEHCAVFQCLLGQDRKALRRIILTASGGPFLRTPVAELEKVTVEDALKHPVWDMGPKVTIDSATLMNKGLEVIEAAKLFSLSWDRIEVLIHPQGVVHSLVEFWDGSVLAQMGPADMRIPISFALGFPERIQVVSSFLDFEGLNFSFEKPDLERFPLLGVAYDVLRVGKSAPAVLNAANEVAVEAFTAGRIKFTDIYRVVKEAIERFGDFVELADIDDVIEVHMRAISIANQVISEFEG